MDPSAVLTQTAAVDITFVAEGAGMGISCMYGVVVRPKVVWVGKYLVTVLARIYSALVLDAHVYFEVSKVDKLLPALLAITTVVFMGRAHMVFEATGIFEDLSALGARVGTLVMYTFDVPFEVAAPRERLLAIGTDV